MSQIFSDAVSVSIGKTSLIKSFENAASVSFGKLLKERLPTSTKLVSTKLQSDTVK